MSRGTVSIPFQLTMSQYIFVGGRGLLRCGPKRLQILARNLSYFPLLHTYMRIIYILLYWIDFAMVMAAQNFLALF
jgi:hypothetical protein